MSVKRTSMGALLWVAGAAAIAVLAAADGAAQVQISPRPGLVQSPALVAQASAVTQGAPTNGHLSL